MSECSNGGLSVWYLINKKELNKQWFLFDNLFYFLLVLKKERKKSIFRYSNFLSMSQLCTLGSCHSPEVWGRRVSCWEGWQPGSMQHPHSTTNTEPGPPKGFRGKESQGKSQETQKLMARFLLISDRWMCHPDIFAADTQISYFIYFNSQLNTFQLTLTPPALLVNWWTTPSCCPAWHYRWTRQSDLP